MLVSSFFCFQLFVLLRQTYCHCLAARKADELSNLVNHMKRLNTEIFNPNLQKLTLGNWIKCRGGWVSN